MAANTAGKKNSESIQDAQDSRRSANRTTLRMATSKTMQGTNGVRSLVMVKSVACCSHHA